MPTDNQSHHLFLEEELKAQTEAFKQKLDTPAKYLLTEREELFIAKFVCFKDGEMILKFSMKAAIPRKGEYLFCFTTPKELHDYRTWGDKTYGDLLKVKGFGSEAIFIWHSPIPEDPGFCLAGFRGIGIEFAEHISGNIGALLILGPNIPPYEYIGNLQKIVHSSEDRYLSHVVPGMEEPEPILLDGHANVPDLLMKQLSLSDSAILMGPPGTGKTTQIAAICKILCECGKSVLITALTNRALIEVAQKNSLAKLLEDGHIMKTKISTDEASELPTLVPTKQIAPCPGSVVMATFFITSGKAANSIGEPPFDYVIMDEASQALTAMFTAAERLGKKRIYVGDVNQLPPVTAINNDRVQRMNYNRFINGMYQTALADSIPVYMLSDSLRLPDRAVRYTGHFYNDALKSDSDKTIPMSYPGIPEWLSGILSQQGGPGLIKTDLKVGDRKPLAATSLAAAITSMLMASDKKLRIAVLSFYVESTKALQRVIYSEMGHSDRLIVDTVSRVQGLTTDVVIYVIPNTGYIWSLDRSLFNVATSRALRHTIIIADKEIVANSKRSDADVHRYLNELEEESSIYISIQSGQVFICNC